MPKDIAELAGDTHVGRVRRNNEDDLFVSTVGRNGSSIHVIAVADGMGGHANGELASQTAIGSLRLGVDELPDATAPSVDEAWLRSKILAAHGTIRDLAPEGEICGTTMTAAVVSGQTCLIGHVGDSRAYLWRKGRLKQLTLDDSGSSPGSLTQAVGVDPEPTVATSSLTVERGDVLLLCSDGLTRHVSDSEIGDTIKRGRSAKAIVKTLIEFALARGGRDNITVCAWRNARPKRWRPLSARTWLAGALILVLAAMGYLGRQVWAERSPAGKPEKPAKLDFIGPKMAASRSGAKGKPTVAVTQPNTLSLREGEEAILSVQQNSVSVQVRSTHAISSAVRANRGGRFVDMPIRVGDWAEEDTLVPTEGSATLRIIGRSDGFLAVVSPPQTLAPAGEGKLLSEQVLLLPKTATGILWEMPKGVWLKVKFGGVK